MYIADVKREVSFRGCPNVSVSGRQIFLCSGQGSGSQIHLCLCQGQGSGSQIHLCIAEQ